MKLSIPFGDAVTGGEIAVANTWGSLKEVTLRVGVALGVSSRSSLDAVVASNAAERTKLNNLAVHGSMAEKLGFAGAMVGLYESAGPAGAAVSIENQIAAPSGSSPQISRPMEQYGFPAIAGVTEMLVLRHQHEATPPNSALVTGMADDSPEMALQTVANAPNMSNVNANGSAFRGTSLEKVDRELSGVLSAMGARGQDAVQNRNPALDKVHVGRMAAAIRDSSAEPAGLDTKWFKSEPQREANVEGANFEPYS